MPIPFSSQPSIQLMSELFTCGTNIALWHYDMKGVLLETSSPHLILDKIFTHIGGKEQMLHYASLYTEPVIFGSDMGLMWGIIFDHAKDSNGSIYVMGPVFNSNISLSTIETSVNKYNISLTFRTRYIELMKELPVVSSILFQPYVLMLHYCVTGEKLTRKELHFQNSVRNDSVLREFTEQLQKDKLDVWYAERALLRMIREGDLDYAKALSSATQLMSNTSGSQEDPWMQALLNMTGFTTLCSREAIQAGISPDTAYTIADTYIKAMSECHSVSELMTHCMTMYEDFLRLVRNHLTMPEISPQIQSCRDYIDLHYNQELSLTHLAARVGYSDYYLSRKFKEEMGLSLSSYIKFVRTDRAKLLLTTTSDSIAKIAGDLHFCSASHFAGVFKKITGKTPQEYRSQNQKF